MNASSEVWEEKEWVDLWWEKPESDQKRVLLIGDSISMGYRESLQNLFKDSLRVDLCATSLSIDNSRYLKLIEYAAHFMGNKYEIIHFNNGLHGFHMAKNVYAQYYEKAFVYLREARPDSEIILATSTPVTVKETTAVLDEKNNTVLERNEVVFTLAEKYGCIVDDLYSLCVNRSEIRKDDGFHYLEEGKKLQADWISAIIKSKLRGFYHEQFV